MSERQVQYALKELEDLGELILARGTGRGHTHKFSMPAFQKWVQDIHPLAKRVQSTTERVQSTTLKGEQIAPEPSLTVIEPKKEKTILLTQLPEWLPPEPWNAYLEMRRRIRKPLVTNRGFSRAISTLDTLRQQGNDPSTVLDQSIFNSWQGLFPLREARNGEGASRKTFDAIRREASAEAIKRTVGAYQQMARPVLRDAPPRTKPD